MERNIGQYQTTFDKIPIVFIVKTPKSVCVNSEDLIEWFVLIRLSIFSDIVVKSNCRVQITVSMCICLKINK
jgi:hypothetical protein